MREVDEALARADFVRADALARALARTVMDGPSARAVVAWCEAEAGASIERAIAALERILSGDPQCARAIYYRAKLNARRGHLADSIRDYRRLLRIAPQYEGAREEMRLVIEGATREDSLPHTSGLRRLHDHLVR
jgi:tetratricopeptide (TPR) repeat protein